jgi:hypothetical protein
MGIQIWSENTRSVVSTQIQYIIATGKQALELLHSAVIVILVPLLQDVMITSLHHQLPPMLCHYPLRHSPSLQDPVGGDALNMLRSMELCWAFNRGWGCRYECVVVLGGRRRV